MIYEYCELCEKFTHYRYLACEGDCICNQSTGSFEGFCNTCKGCLGGDECEEIICTQCGQ